LVQLFFLVQMVELVEALDQQLVQAEADMHHLMHHQLICRQFILAAVEQQAHRNQELVALVLMLLQELVHTIKDLELMVALVAVLAIMAAAVVVERLAWELVATVAETPHGRLIHLVLQEFQPLTLVMELVEVVAVADQKLVPDPVVAVDGALMDLLG
jgi:hypothetical protein